METVNFTCDFCGTKSEEESAVWRRPRCSVELVLRGHRFTPLAGSHALYGVPFSESEIEDSRWAATLCDRCMKRISALLGLALETPEETRWREEQLARSVASAAAAGMRGVMTDQFPTPDVDHPVARGAPFAPVSVVQYTTPKRTRAGKDDPGVNDDHPADPDASSGEEETPSIVPPATGAVVKPAVAGAKKVPGKKEEVEREPKNEMGNEE